jgi:hypothetical protein
MIDQLLLSRILRFDQEAQIFWLPSPNTSVEQYMDSILPRIPGTLQWRNVKENIVKKAISFVKTVTSGIVSEEELEKRKLACFGDTNTPACPAMQADKTGKYCGACGCGRWLLSNLDGTAAPKLQWTSTKCPLRRF